ncbi:iron chelate uptake ABC transporter family permease subunit [Lysinibacter sp. HNR]|uniref:FecCD family ABC transporter permease n=1 Tax=Lysinibacter sp. HNR TaxID=3031408 RepID=UPI002434AF99|nr:iron chelate uptake ABC transporter family permease subunit [Lysinibacter sp. HNR]WGD37957.1 iron chelate uptake ABC transporter family permease subunit [Lysinibacter sp. HNR]
MSVSSHDVVTQIRAGRRRRQIRTRLTMVTLLILVLAIFALSLMVGRTFYSLDEVIAVMLGDTVPGASFTVGELRLPRAVTGLLAGFAFGAAGAIFQGMLRNPLASPDIIGISAGAGAFAVIGIIALSLSETAVSFLALGGALFTAAAIYLLSNRKGFTSIRFILIGIGVGAMMQSVISYLLSRAASWEIQSSLQWLTGSLNGATWQKVAPLAFACVVCVPLLVLGTRALDLLRIGDDAATALGVPVRVTRVALILAAVVLLAFATAAAGPIAFVAFMSGPIAARLVTPGAALTVPAGVVGALLVLVSDLAGQYLFGERYPVGVITGVLGAPYLILLLIRRNRTGSSL